MGQKQTQHQHPLGLKIGILTHPLEKCIKPPLLTFARHISSLYSKISRYIGIMCKLKRFLALKTRIQIYHSFVLSHKKGMRAVIPGYIQYRNRDGVTAGHTEPFLTIMTFLQFNFYAQNTPFSVSTTAVCKRNHC